MSNATIPLPPSVSEAEARQLLAVKLFETGRVSVGQAAEVAGLSKRTFVELLGRQQGPVFNSPADELARDLANA